MRKVAVVTGTRAEYGLLYWIIKGIHEDPKLKLQLIVTGMHLSPEFGLTVREIEKDGFPTAEKLKCCFLPIQRLLCNLYGSWHDRFCKGL